MPILSSSRREKIERVWQYSHHFGNRLFDCEALRREDKGYCAIMLLLILCENIVASVLDDYNSKYEVQCKKLFDQQLVSEEEYKFLSADDYSLRKLRNIFAHRDLNSYVLDINGVACFLSEEDAASTLYDIYVDDALELFVKLIERSK